MVSIENLELNMHTQTSTAVGAQGNPQTTSVTRPSQPRLSFARDLVCFFLSKAPVAPSCLVSIDS